jgi:hypothetical protein
LKILLDEYVDWRLACDIVAREVTAARQMGWGDPYQNDEPGM